MGGADTVKFEEHEEDKLLDFLRNHPRNGYVWRGYMDLQALSNKYGMPIQIISINDFSDPNPKSERIEPDADFVVEKVINEMILLNTGQCHFDLIKKKQPEKRTQNSTKDLKINEPQKVLNDVLEKEASVDLNKGVSKSDKVEISELKVLVEGMRKEIINLKQNKCQCVKVTDTGKSLNNGTKTCGPKPNESIESGHETTKNVWQKQGKNTQNENKCCLCEKTFLSKTALDSHMKEKHVRSYECNLCDFKSSLVNALEQHKEVTHNKNFKCKKCDKTLQSDVAMKKHMEIHERKSKMEDFNCDTCPFQNTKRKALKEHLEVSPGHKPCSKEYECRDCKERYNSYFNLMNHRSTKHPTNKMCRYFKEGKCNYEDDKCWYSHVKASHKTVNKEVSDKNEDFQERTKNLPPDLNVLINQIIKIATEKKI